METLTKHFRELTRSAFARYGFAQAELLARWPEIAGEELSRVSEPERIKWPRGLGDNAQRTGGTLVIRAAPGRGLELQYEVPRIIERLNRFFGYGAIASIKIVQAGSWPATGPAPLPELPQKKLFEQSVAAIEDDGLRAALERLGAGVAAARGSPQGK